MNKIYFQGTYGAYSHLAALSIDSKAKIIPCKTFDECFLNASNEKNAKLVMKETNCDGVKLEGGKKIISIIKTLVKDMA